MNENIDEELYISIEKITNEEQAIKVINYYNNQYEKLEKLYLKNKNINDFEIELMNKMKQLNQIDKIVNIYQQNMLIATNNRHYDFLELKEKHRHIELMKDKEIIMKDKEIKMKDKEIELKKLELQIIQSTK